jgi:hypothetical protein
MYINVLKRHTFIVCGYNRYRGMWQWGDGSIAHYSLSGLRDSIDVSSSEQCWAHIGDDPRIFLEGSCNMPQDRAGLRERFKMSVLCEFEDERLIGSSLEDTATQTSIDNNSNDVLKLPPKPGPQLPTDDDRNIPTIHIQSPPSSSNITLALSGLSLMTCPAGHVTHNFLSCDRHSACWWRAEDDGSQEHTTSRAARAGFRDVEGERCRAAMEDGPLPPSLPCRDGAGSVPYTLVCDHRADCWDNNDEDFCVFPPCPYQHYSCGNGQVGPPIHLYPFKTHSA